jgi:hypothetical protein
VLHGTIFDADSTEASTYTPHYIFVAGVPSQDNDFGMNVMILNYLKIVTESHGWEGTSLLRRGFDQERLDKSFNCIHSFVNECRIGNYVMDQ